MLLKGPGATGSPIPACSGRVHPNSLFQQSYAFTNAPRSPLLILAVPAAIAGYFCARLFRPLARGASLFG